MKLKKFLITFIIFFSTSLIITIGITYMWSLLFKDIAQVNWETSFQMAILLGLVFPIIEVSKNIKND